MKRRKKNRLFYLLLLLFVTVISLSVSSYAWFTSNRLVKVDLLNVSVKAQGGIEISVDGSNWKSSVSADDITKARENYPNSVNQIPSVLEPVSSVMDIDNGKVKLFYGVASNNSDGDYILDTTRSIEEESFGNDSNGKFVTFDLFLKVNKDTDLYLTPESNVTYGGDTSFGIENAVRFAFVLEGSTFTGSSLDVIQNLTTNDRNNVYVWEPNYDVHTPNGVNNARDVYGINIGTTSDSLLYDGVAKEFDKDKNITTTKANSRYYPEYFSTVKVDYYTISGFNNNVKMFNIKNGISKIRVYMWIEGQDVDCENNASIGNVALSLQFSSNPS
mgnify:FL=1